MTDIPLKPRDFTSARQLRQREPYHFQRERAAIRSAFPRPAQPNTSQPNAVIRPKPTAQQDYWAEVSKQYMKRRGLG